MCMILRLYMAKRMTLILNFLPGPNRSDPEETAGEEGHDVRCKEIPERSVFTSVAWTLFPYFFYCFVTTPIWTRHLLSTGNNIFSF